MKALLLCFSLVFLAGCETIPKDQCADRPIYKPYKVEIPDRPVLTSNVTLATEGEVVRAAETDLSLLAEYAQKLENLIKALPQNLSIPK